MQRAAGFTAVAADGVDSETTALRKPRPATTTSSSASFWVPQRE